MIDMSSSNTITITDPPASLSASALSAATGLNCVSYVVSPDGSRGDAEFDGDLTAAMIDAIVTRSRMTDNEAAIHADAKQALAANRTYLQTANTATAAEVRAQVAALTRQMNGLIRLAIRQLDGTD